MGMVNIMILVRIYTFILISALAVSAGVIETETAVMIGVMAFIIDLLVGLWLNS